MPSNSEIARNLYELARLATLAEGSSNAFRVRAYETAARTIDGHPERVDEMSESELTRLRGVGKSTAAKIRELVETGSITRLEELRTRFPPGFVALTRVPGVGPKTAVMLHQELGISDVESLKAAIDRQELRALPGMGEKTEENIRHAIERLGAAGKENRTPIIEAGRIAREVCEELLQMRGVRSAEPMGSLRRFRDTIGDIDIIAVSAGDPEEVMKRFVELPVVREVVGYGARKSAIVGAMGLQIDLRVVEPSQFGSAAVYFTGSKAHNIRLRQMALDRGWTLNEYALSDLEGGAVVASKTEEDVYSALGLPWIPPEIREDTGEIEAALAGELPVFATVKDLKGDLHVHTDLSGDGHVSLADVVADAAGRGYRYLAISDHGENLTINGLTREQLLGQRRSIARLQDRYPDMTILQGAELNIAPDGTVDYDAEFLGSLDFGVASVHSHFGLSAAEQTARVTTAMRNPAVNVIGHLTGRRIGKRPGIDLDLDEVLAVAAETGCALEVNCHLDRLDAPSEVLRRAMEHEGVHFAISTDTHRLHEMDNTVNGVRLARRGWVEKSRIVNTWPQRRFLKWVRDGRR
ncbi:MAG TPA: DNA polymerase/3'-5' exonuclease PolX [Acidimicrobiia bacterium]|nr:DNA polymerase/3'-5' exonuclease PolX [Acidimicrobiia bacterium]